ncbi:MAG: hypothetical protein ACRC2O_01120, partial [Chitinophagaceae bacterium]
LPPPSAPIFKTLSLADVANMDLWDKGGKKSVAWMNAKGPGNDMRGLPVGEQIFKGIEFNVQNPDKNDRKSAIAVSILNGFPRSVTVPVDDTAGAVYLLHSSSDNVPSNVAGSITFLYADGTQASEYMMKNKQVTNWWFPNLQTERSGVAWFGPNLKSTQVGVCWAAIDNPFPAKKIAQLQFNAPLEGGIYAVLGITLADKPYYIAPKGESYGGPDNWAAANGMAALVEGLAGVKNEGLGFDKVKLSPRWSSAGIDSADVTIDLPASNGYVAYQYRNNRKIKQIDILITTSGTKVNAHVLLAENVNEVSRVAINNKPVSYTISKVEASKYVDFELPLPSVNAVVIKYE